MTEELVQNDVLNDADVASSAKTGDPIIEVVNLTKKFGDLLVLDDFSLGLDPGYRRLFIEYLREYAKAENKTVFLT